MSAITRAEVKFPISSFRHRSKKGGYHCDLCAIFLGRQVEQANAHAHGKKHRQRLVTGQEYSIDDLEESENSYCDVCQVHVFWSAPYEEWAASCRVKTLRKHVQGRKHAKYLNWRVAACRKDLEASTVYKKLPALVERGYRWGKFPSEVAARIVAFYYA